MNDDSLPTPKDTPIPQPAPQVPQQAPEQPPESSPEYPLEDVEKGKLLAVLSYVISPLWIVPLIQRDNAFALFHAKQAMILNIVGLAMWLVIMVISVITCGIGGFLGFAGVILLYPWIMGVVASANGKYEAVPWFGSLADKYLANMVADKRPQG
jgi:uncharacterized membrane protein